jgi:hypothetical protein
VYIAGTAYAANWMPIVANITRVRSAAVPRRSVISVSSVSSELKIVGRVQNVNIWVSTFNMPPKQLSFVGVIAPGLKER